MKKTQLILGIASLTVAAAALSGCSVGMAPSGGSAEDVKAAFDKMSMEDQIKVTKEANIPADAKKKKLEEIYAKFGKTPPADEGAAPSGPPPGVGTPSQGGR